MALEKFSDIFTQDDKVCWTIENFWCDSIWKMVLATTSIDLSSTYFWRLNVVKCNFSKVLQYMSKTCLWLCQDILTLDMLIPPIEIKTSICAASKRWGPFPKWGTVMIFRGTIIASCISGPKYPLHGFPFHFWVIAPPTNLEKKEVVVQSINHGFISQKLSSFEFLWSLG